MSCGNSEFFLFGFWFAKPAGSSALLSPPKSEVWGFLDFFECCQHMQGKDFPFNIHYDYVSII